MIAPWNYRPANPADPNDGETDDWEDNWLSNSLAWSSRTFMPAWCATPDHWTSRLSGYFYATCPCCLFFRGIIFGFALIISIDFCVALMYIAIM